MQTDEKKRRRGVIKKIRVKIRKYVIHAPDFLPGHFFL